MPTNWLSALDVLEIGLDKDTIVGTAGFTRDLINWKPNVLHLFLTVGWRVPAILGRGTWDFISHVWLVGTIGKEGE